MVEFVVQSEETIWPDCIRLCGNFKSYSSSCQTDGEDVIPKSMQLFAGQTGQEYNKRKNRKGRVIKLNLFNQCLC